MQSALPLACFLSMIRPPGVMFENSLLQIAPVDKAKCPFVRDHNDIEFRLYTRHNPTVYQELIMDDDEKLFASHIDYHAPTVIFFHAFMENADDGSAARVREAYILRGDTNIIMVDASRLEAGPWYFTAAENTWFIGKFAAQFIDYLVSRGLDLKKTHLVGHSLGAQAAGVAGSAIKSGRVSRITGLDPALPLFAHLPPEQRLDRSDADFVDVIHTDSGIFGVNKPVGHADFYPNGGISPQPGCELEVVIPQQLLLNKCQNNTQPRDYYVFYLTPHGHKKSATKLERNLQKLFTKIQFLKPNKMDERDEVKITKKDRTFTPNQEVKHIMGNEKQEVPYEDQDMVESVAKYQKIAINTNINKENKTVEENKTSIKENQAQVTQQNHEIINKKSNTHKHEKTLNQTRLEHNNKQLNINNARQHEKLAANNQETEDTSRNSQQQNEKATPQPLEQDPKNNDQEATENKTHNNKKQNKETSHAARQKRFINPFKPSEAEQQDNLLFRMLEFLFKHRKSIPVYSVMREINTLVRSGHGELNHVSKERNNYIGAPPPLVPVTYSLELGNESKAIAFMKKLLGLSPKGDRLTISGTG